MFKSLTMALFLSFTLGCAGTKTAPTAAAEKNYFSDIQGCFLLYNVKTGAFEKVINAEICKERFPACSTFKVPLAVMAFDAKVLKDENTVSKWNGVKDVREAANKDHTAQTWMRDSVVWYSQRITPKLGKKKFQKYLNDFNYGNKDLSAGIKQAWLEAPSKKSGLKISAYEQVEFMKALWQNKLPVSERSMQLTRDITYLETSPKGFKLNGKTGSNFYDKEHKVHFGWFIAHIQNDNQEYIAVTNFKDLTPNDVGNYGGPRAKALTKEILADQGLW